MAEWGCVASGGFLEHVPCHGGKLTGFLAREPLVTNFPALGGKIVEVLVIFASFEKVFGILFQPY